VKTFCIKGLFTGRVAALSNGKMSAIKKYPTDFITIKFGGIDCDQNANTLHHGGEMRAVHHYSSKNYDSLKETFPELRRRLTPGSFGENILTDELDESELFVGDIFDLGEAQLQLTVPRRPCATLNYTYEDPRILEAVILTGRVGWFYKVLREGKVSVKDELILARRPYPQLNILKLHRQGYSEDKFSDLDFLKRCLMTGLMDKGWQLKIGTALGNAES
jgi:MOSC domain-containing protein YiiM